jgi:hypothetical protein
MGDQSILAVTQARFRPELSGLLAVLLGDLIRIEEAGVDVDTASGADPTAIAFVRMDCTPLQPMQVIIHRSEHGGVHRELSV